MMTTDKKTPAAAEYSNNLRRIHSQTLDLPPSCIEFLPPGNSTDEEVIQNWNEYFVVGTYHLQSSSVEESTTQNEEDAEDDEDKAPTPPKPQERDGSLSLFRIKDEKLTLIDKTPFPAGILDLHFIPNHQTFAVASSTGTVSFYNFQTSRSQYQDQDQSHDPSHPTFHPIVTHQIFPTAILILSITWILTTTPNPPLLVATLNTGEIYLLYFPSWDFLSYKIMNEGLPLATHSAESWISAVCPTLNHIYTGGDDIKLRIHDINLYELNQHPEIDVSVTETFKPRGHEAGITAVLPLPHLSPRLFLTGSYDDHIRIFSVLLSGQAKVVTSLYLGGGVWRLKFLSPYPLITSPEGAVRYKVLASCMHAGVKILEVSCDEKGEEWEVEEVAWCTEHKSMNYASDVQPLCVERNEVEMGNENEKKKRVCVSTSFYDMLLVVWEFDPSLPPGENS